MRWRDDKTNIFWNPERSGRPLRKDTHFNSPLDTTSHPLGPGTGYDVPVRCRPYRGLQPGCRGYRKQCLTTTADIGYFMTGALTPAIANNTLYVASVHGDLLVLNATTGQEQWNSPISVFRSSPAVANGIVYVGSSDGNIYALGRDISICNG